jgi:hypothetical protein
MNGLSTIKTLNSHHDAIKVMAFLVTVVGCAVGANWNVIIQTYAIGVICPLIY